MRTRETNEDDDAQATALRALAWTLSEPERATRLVMLTGLDPSDLRQRIGDPSVLAASLAFLEAHEPDLLACAADIGVQPAALVRARQTLEAA